jgi:hypothetical protein
MTNILVKQSIVRIEVFIGLGLLPNTACLASAELDGAHHNTPRQ